jgi:hypothetical protein
MFRLKFYLIFSFLFKINVVTDFEYENLINLIIRHEICEKNDPDQQVRFCFSSQLSKDCL